MRQQLQQQTEQHDVQQHSVRRQSLPFSHPLGPESTPHSHTSSTLQLHCPVPSALERRAALKPSAADCRQVFLAEEQPSSPLCRLLTAEALRVIRGAKRLKSQGTQQERMEVAR